MESDHLEGTEASERLIAVDLSFPPKSLLARDKISFWLKTQSYHRFQPV
jgi:hypothetical protein